MFQRTGGPRSKTLKTNARLKGSNSGGKLIGTKKRKFAKTTTLSSASSLHSLAENHDEDGAGSDDDGNSDCWIPDDEEDYEESDCMLIYLSSAICHLMQKFRHK